MAREEEIKTRLTADASDHIRALEQASESEKKFAGGVKHTGEEAQDASGKVSELSDETSKSGMAFEGMSNMTAGLIGRLISLAALSGTLMTFLTEAAEATKKWSDNTADLGEQLRGLSANIGGVNAAAVHGDVTRIAAENRFDVQGRQRLLEGVTTLTDLQPNLSQEDIIQGARDLAMLQRATGVGGSVGTETLLSMEQNLGLTRAQSLDATVAALNSGIDANALQEIATRGGNVGGLDAVALMLGAREHGLNVNRAGRSMPTLIAALTKRDTEGNLDESLARLGISEDQDFVQRLTVLLHRQAAGEISQGEFETAIGGAENMRLVAPMSRALTSGAFGRARASLLDEQAAEGAIRELQANPFVRAQERRNLRELYTQVQQELPTARGEALKQVEADHPDSTIGYYTALIGESIPIAFSPEDPERRAGFNERDINRGVDETMRRAFDPAVSGQMPSGTQRAGAVGTAPVNISIEKYIHSAPQMSPDGLSPTQRGTGRTDLP